MTTEGHAARITGVGVSAGYASGPAVRIAEALGEPATTPAPADPEVEAAQIAAATRTVVARLERLAESATGDAASVLATTAAMAGDPALISQAEQLVATEHVPAARAIWEAAGTFTRTVAAAGGYMAERVRDIEDVRDRIVAELLDRTPPGVPVLDTPSVLVARDLAPADTAGLDPAMVLALVTEEGGPTSHTAILARSLGIPAVVAARGVLGTNAQALAVNGDSGVIQSADSHSPVRAARLDAAADWDGYGATADGHRVRIFANVGSEADAYAAVAAGAEGVGLFRTEFGYLDAVA